MISDVQQAERRAFDRVKPAAPIGVRRLMPTLPISDARVVNISQAGVAIHTAVPVQPGSRLSFAMDINRPPILAEVLACEPIDGQLYRVRCRCLLGAFDV